MALLATFRRGAASCCRKIFQTQRCQHTASAFDQFSGEELYSDVPEEQLASAGTQALRTDTFVREVPLTHCRFSVTVSLFADGLTCWLLRLYALSCIAS